MSKKKILTILAGLAIGASVPILPAEPLSPVEFQALIQMYNHEIQEICEITNEAGCAVNFTSDKQEEMFKQMNAKIKARPIKEAVYAEKRDELILKYEKSLEKKSIINKLL